MKKSIVYIIVLVTVCSLSFTLIPGSFSQTANVKILSYSWYIDSSNMLEVVGEVQNVGTSIIGSVILSGGATTTTGTQIPSSTQVFVTDLLPQQKAPFLMSIYIQGPDITGQISTPEIATVGLAVAKADPTTSYIYQDLKFTTQTNSVGTGTDDLGIYFVSGTVQNAGSQTSQNVRVLGTFYDSSGNVIAVGGYTDVDPLVTSLAPSATVNFKIDAFDTNETQADSSQKIAGYSLLIQNEGPISQGDAPSVTPVPTTTSGPVDTTSPTSTQSASSNPTVNTGPITNAGIPTWIYAVIVVVAIAVVAGAVLAVKKRKPKQ